MNLFASMHYLVQYKWFEKSDLFILLVVITAFSHLFLYCWTKKKIRIKIKFEKWMKNHLSVWSFTAKHLRIFFQQKKEKFFPQTVCLGLNDRTDDSDGDDDVARIILLNQFSHLYFLKRFKWYLNIWCLFFSLKRICSQINWIFLFFFFFFFFCFCFLMTAIFWIKTYMTMTVNNDVDNV